MAADNLIELIFKARTSTATKDVRALGSEIRGIGARADASSRTASSGFNRTAGSIAGLAGRLAVGAGAVLLFQKGISRAISKGTEFESALADLEAITGITGDRLDRLGDQSLELSKTYGESAADIIEANKLVASVLAEKIDFGTEAGFEQLQQISEQAVILQKAAGIDLSTAVNVTASAINQFNLEASQSGRVINTLAAGSKFGAAEVGVIGRALETSGVAAAGAGASIETTNAAIQVLSANAITGERAGTALRAIFLRLQTSAGDLAELGIENVDIKANGLVETLRQLNPIVSDAAAIKKIFGEEAFNAATALITQADSLESLQEKVTGTNTAHEQAAVTMDTFQGATDRLQSTIDAALIPAFTETGGLLVQLVTSTTSLIENFAGGIRVINDWLDVHSDLRKELELEQHATSTSVETMSDLRRELAEYAMQGSLTAAEEGELKASFEATTESLRSQASALFDETFARKQRREEVEKDIAELERIRKAGGGLGLAQQELAALNLEIGSNQERLDGLAIALQEGAIGWDAYIEKIRQLKEEQTGGGGAGDSTQTLTEKIKDLKEQYQALINQPSLSEADIFKGFGLQKDLQAAEQQLKDRQALLGGMESPEFDILAEISGDTAGLEAGVEAGEQAAHEKRMQDIDDEKTAKLNADVEEAESERKKQKDIIAARAQAVGQGVAQAILYADSIEDAASKAVNAIAKVLMVQWVTNALQTAGASGPLALALSPILAAVAISAARGLISTITKAETGGRIGGRLHAQGGTIIEAERDEFITNRRSATAAPRTLHFVNSSPGAARRVEAMFDQFAGLPTAQDGGAVAPQMIPRIVPGPAGFDSEGLKAAVREAIMEALPQATIIFPITDFKTAEHRFENKERSIGND